MIIDWNDKTNDRRKHDSPGRRAADYVTCHNHEETCDRVKMLETRMVGWRVFNLVIGGLGAAIIFTAGLTWSINVKVDALSEKINILTVEVKTHTSRP
jgi:hypothetical protein